ncbi:MAG: Hyaluronan synthase [Bacteroidetes bacterium ADurb.Bin408]|nr:MAG: Hyaluronan synthase [Bacteroidetes bacterium ADurb.Bin408]
MNKPDLSICIISCNQAQFIEHAVTSVLKQQTGYSLELIICDDNSADNTEQIISTLLAGTAIPFKFIRKESQAGPLHNGKDFFLLHAGGRYICWMDADDYWNYPAKVETQLKFLEQNPDYAGCFHDAEIKSLIHIQKENSHQLKTQTHGKWKFYSQFNHYSEDYFPWHALQRQIIPTASLIVRNKELHGFYERYKDINLSVSWALHLEFIKNSRFRYFNEPWSVYLDHKDGLSKKVNLLTFKLNNIKILEQLLTDSYYKTIIKDVYKAIAQEYYHLLHTREAQELPRKVFNTYCSLYKKWMKRAVEEEITSFKELNKSRQ